MTTAASVPVSPVESRPGWKAFPADHLPPTLANLTRTAADSLCCDPAYVALPALAVCASAIGTSRRILARPDWSEPPVLWCVSIGRSGTMKSPPMDVALDPLRAAEGEAFREHAREMDGYQREYAEWERKRAEWRKPRSNKEQEEGDDRGDPPAKPAAPVCMRYTTADCTIEALGAILAGNPRGVLLARDELAGWIRSFDAYRQGKGGDEARWLELHRAGTLLIDRKTGEPRTIRIERAACSVCGTIQPGTLERLLTREYIESGLAGRMLVAHPPVKRKRWTDGQIPSKVMCEYDRTVRGLLALEHDANEHEEPIPRDVPLSTEARDHFAAWYDDFAARQANAETDAEAAALAKCEGAALRLALVHHLARFVNGKTLDNAVTVESIRAGIGLAEWFAGEAQRLYGFLNESDDERERRKLAEWIGQRGGDVAVRDVYHGHRRFKSTDEARAELKALVASEQGELYFYQHPKGGQPSERFRLLSGVTSTDTTAHDGMNRGIGDGDSIKTAPMRNGQVPGDDYEVIA